LPSGEPPFDVVLANLIAGLLVTLASPLRDELRPGGVLLASGIFIDREPDVRAAFEAVGLDVRDHTVEGEWIALEAVRR
jgi:ribosomal protein L11 methyltransferase